MTLDQIEKRISEIMLEVDSPSADLEKLNSEIDNLILEKKKIKNNAEQRKATASSIANGTAQVKTIKRFGDDNKMEYKELDNTEDNLEVRSLQKYLINGTRNMTDTEERSLVLSGSAAVIPTQIYNKLITDTKYSDLLSRATVITEVGPGKINIPIASNNTATWKVELAPVDEASPLLTKLELGGFELMRLLEMSSAANSMTTSNFQGLLLQLLSSEVVETLENSFINGSGVGQPLGLNNLDWTTGTNQILTTEAAEKITANELAKGISLLSQRYSRNAVILVNSDMMYQISMFKGTSEYAYGLENSATHFLGKEIIVSELIENDAIYVVDPKELYIRFSMPITVEADRSVGFKSASIWLRALTVVDSVWNPAAVVKIGLGA